MKLIYANIVWFGLLIVGLINSNIGRYSSQEWSEMTDVRLNYTLLYGGVTLLLLVAIAGLFLKKKWGYELALASNSSMAILPISIFVVSFIMLPTLTASELLSIHALNLVVGSISLAFWFALVRSGVKAKYVQ